MSRQGMVRDFKPLQPPAKTNRSTEFTLFGIVREVKPLQPAKAQLSMKVTLFGIVREVKPLQP